MAAIILRRVLSFEPNTSDPDRRMCGRYGVFCRWAYGLLLFMSCSTTSAMYGLYSMRCTVCSSVSYTRGPCDRHLAEYVEIKVTCFQPVAAQCTALCKITTHIENAQITHETRIQTHTKSMRAILFFAAPRRNSTQHSPLIMHAPTVSASCMRCLFVCANEYSIKIRAPAPERE